jgi:hypothetical protein
MPQDVFLRSVYGLTPTECLDLWRRKLDHIVSVGGVAVLNLHPVWVNPGAPKMWAIYRTLLDEFAARTDIRVTTPSAVAARF